VTEVATAIGALVLRHRAVVAGEVQSVASYERPWVRIDAEVTDGTGSLLLRFVGRPGIPGLAVGSRIVAQGTPGLVGGILVMLNPRYAFTVTTDRPQQAGTRCRERS
jgi:hypothetical protein